MEKSRNSMIIKARPRYLLDFLRNFGYDIEYQPHE
jgi:hypothetical protein